MLRGNRFNDVVMSAVQLPADVDDELDTAVETIRNAQEGDEVLWGDRSQPLTITDTGGEPGEDRYLVVQGPRGASYTIREAYTDNGIPEFRTDEGHAVEKLRPANFEPKDRIPRFTDWKNVQHDDASPGVQTEEMGESVPDGFSEFDIMEGDGELRVEGYHDETNTQFELVYYGDDEYRLDQSESQFGELGISSEAILVDDVESYLSEEGFSLNPTTPGSSEREFESRPAEDASEVDADDFVVENTQEVMDYNDLVKKTGTPESDQPPESFIDRLTEDAEESWTFVDEVLTIGEDVPKTVNNWHLIDYGVVTDETMDVSRKLAWYNVETESLLVLGGAKNNDGDVRWFVYHVPDTTDISDEERNPAHETDDLTDALDYAEEILYDSDEEVDFSVRENPATGEVTVYDALTSTNLARALVRAKSADPYGLRTYVQEASLPQFIRDLDMMLYRLFKRAQSTSSNVRTTWAEFSEGAKLPTPQRIWAFIAGINPRELGNRTRMAFMASVTGLQKRFTGLTIYPTIKYNEFGVDVEYKYTPGDREKRRSVMSLTTDPRITREVTDEQGNVIREEVHGFVIDSLLPRGLSYYQLVDVAEWADVNDWWFEIPDPWSDRTDGFSAGTTGGQSRKGSASGATATDYSDFIREQGGQESSAMLVRPQELDKESVNRIAGNYDEEPAKQKYIYYLAILNAGMEEFGDTDKTDIRELNRQKNQFASKMGNYRSEFESLFEEDGFDKRDFEWDVWYDAYGAIQYEGPDEVKALDAAIGQYDEDAAQSGDFTDIYFRKSDEPEPETVEQSSDDQPDQGEDADIESQGIPAPENPPGGQGGDEDSTSLSQNEQERVNEIAARLASGEETPDTLGVGDRNLMSKAQEELGILPEGMYRELEQIREQRQRQQEEDLDPADATVNDMIAQADLDRTSQMDADERATVVNSWAEELDEDPGTGYSQEDMIPPEEREDQL